MNPETVVAEAEAETETAPSLPWLVGRISTVNTALATVEPRTLIAVDPQTETLITQAMGITDLRITSPEERTEVDQLARALREKRDAAELEYRRYKDPVVKLGQFFDAAWRHVKAACDGAIRVCDTKVLAYDRDVREAAERERVRLQRIADEEAERERQRLIRETEKAAQKANGVEKRALKDEVRDLKATEAVAAPVVVATKVAESMGQKTRLYWTAEVTDLRLLLQAILSGDVDAATIEPNLPYLNQQARSLARLDGTNGMNVRRMNGKMPFPGVRAVPDERRGR